MRDDRLSLPVRISERMKLLLCFLAIALVPSCAARLRGTAVDGRDDATASITTKDDEAMMLPAPVVGIFSQPFFNRSSDDEYIAASYAKWLEAGGMRTVPIPYTASAEFLDDVLQQINGLFLPGGSALLNSNVTYMLNRIAALNNQGHFFPVWGTCLGFEWLIEWGAQFANEHHNFDANFTILSEGFVATNLSLPLLDVRPSGLYSDPTIYMTVTTENVTLNNHNEGIRPDVFWKNEQLSSLWVVTSTNVDEIGQPFVSTVEPRYPEQFPVYGVQYHPEKNAFEYATYPHTNIPYESIHHGARAVHMSVYMSHFFGDLVRKAQRLQYPRQGYDKVDSYPPLYTYPLMVGTKFEQIYLVPSADVYRQHQEERVAFAGLQGGAAQANAERSRHAQVVQDTKFE